MKQSFTILKLISFFALVVISTSATAQFTVTENFRSSGGADIVVGDGAHLTSGVEDPVGAGWLRLTRNDNSQKGYAYINRSFPSTQGVLVDFEYTMWRSQTGIGADGISVFLFDANYGPGNFELGAYGGSLGYANSNAITPNNPGLTGGYIGIGLDAYGNFTAASEGKNGGSTNTSPNSVVLRGATTGDFNTTNPYLDGVTITNVSPTGITFDPDARNENGNASIDGVDYNTPTSTRPDYSAFYRRVQIEILPVAGNNYEITIRMAAEYGGVFTDLMTYTTSTPPPPLLKLGFAAATGGSVNNHEIRNLRITTLGNLRVHKSANVNILRSQSSTTTSGPSNEITYNIEVTNDTAADLNTISFDDQLVDGNGNPIPEGMFEITSITTDGFLSGTTLPSPTSSAPITNGKFIGLLKLGANSTGTISVEGHLNAVPKQNVLINTSTALPSNIDDTDLSNNTSSVSTPVVSESSDLVINSSVDQTCLNGVDGNTVTLNVRNIGLLDITYGDLPGNELTVSTTLPSGVTASNTSNSGWTPDQNGNILTFTKDVPEGETEILAYNQSLPPITYTLNSTNGYIHDVEVACQTEDPGNLTNNTDSNNIASPPNPPVVSTPTITYCQFAEAVPLTATADSGNTLLWSLSDGGVTTTIPYTPNTSIAGTTEYWVAQQTPGGCISNFTQITVDVSSASTVNPGSIGTQQEICPGTQPQTLTSIDDGNTGAGLSYIWQKSTDYGSTWTTIPGETGATFQPVALNEITFFRRVTENTAGCQYATEPVGIYMATSGNCTISLCTAEVPGASFNWAEPAGTPSPVIQTLVQPATNAGFVFDVYVLDNSFNMEINGTQLAVDEIEFQSASTSGINIQFEDGDQYETSNAGTIWQMTGETGKPLIRVEIAPSGQIQMYGSKVSSTDAAYQLYPLEFIPSMGNSFNTIHWNTTGNNTIVVTQNVQNATTMSGYGSGQSLAPCDPYSLTKEGVFNDESGNGVAEAGETITYSLSLQNSGDIDIYQPEISDPMFGGAITATPTGDVNNDGVLNTTETWTYSLQYTLTQPDIDAGGVYNLATVAGKTVEGYGLDPVDSTDPTPLAPTDDNYDPNRSEHTFVKLPPPMIISNPMLPSKARR